MTSARAAGMRLAGGSDSGGVEPGGAESDGVSTLTGNGRLLGGASRKVGYAELHCHSAMSFLDGAATPEQIVDEAAALELDAIALTDHDGFYGAPRFAEAARDAGVATIYGAELTLGLGSATLRSGPPDPPGQHLLVLARGQEGYRRLSRQIAAAHLAGKEKGRPDYDLDDLTHAADGHWLILTGCRKGAVRTALEQHGMAAAEQELRQLVDRFGADNVAVEVTRQLTPTDDDLIDALAELAATVRLPLVATTGAHYANPEGAKLAAAMAAVRARRSLDEADPYLPAGPGSHLRSGTEMAHLFARHPEAVETAARLGAECAFDLHLVAPELPPYPVPPGHDEASYLRELTLAGARRRYGAPGDNPRAYEHVERELRIITELNFPGYFLVVWDIVQFCRRENILCQGRGSAANSAVCYALGITAVDAVSYGLLFERFLSPVRQGPPDIDLDIEARRREEVIQYVYGKYGRDRAAQVANVATYRSKMAVRDMAAALGYSPGQRDAYTKHLGHWGSIKEQLGDAGTGGGPGQGDGRVVSDQISDDVIPRDVLGLAEQIQDFPRHLGIHSGGMVICDRPIADVVPIEWARKEGRTVLQWDKDDCAAIGLVKFDLLGLGILTAIHEALTLVRDHEGIDIDLAALDLEEPAIYDMLGRADAIGVFQVESRAQLATLPRLKPERFYDLVIEIALIRPGPIQGGSVHPYLKRRAAVRAGTWRGPLVDHPAMRRSLEKTLGIPLFQEQLMELAIDVAGFDAGQADLLRKAMGSKRAVEKMKRLKKQLYDGMWETNQIRGALADTIFERLQAFANFGFAESHALSFASLVFYSAYLKLHHPAAYLVGLLRAQPMGFYSPQSLVADARRHGVTVRRAHVNHSATAAGLEDSADAGGRRHRPAVRLGLAGIRGIGTDIGDAIAAQRPIDGYRSIVQVVLAVQQAGLQLSAAQAESLATAGALDGLGSAGTDPCNRQRSPRHARRVALWAAGAATTRRSGMLPDHVIPHGHSDTEPPLLPGMSDVELALADISATGISPDRYPTEFSRDRLRSLGVRTAAELYTVPAGTRVRVAGIVTHRQRPPTAAGVTFLNLEDETGMINIICQQGLWRRYRAPANSSRSLIVRGIIERDRGSLSLVADRIAAITMVGALPSRDFR